MQNQETLLSMVRSPTIVSSASKEVKYRWSGESFEPHQHMNDVSWKYLLFNTRVAVADPGNKFQLHFCRFCR